MSFNKRNKKRERWIGKERDLVDSSADELAAENNVTKQDGEITAWLWVLRLLIQHEPCYCHQVRPVCFRRVIHFLPFFSFLSSLPLSLKTPWCSIRGQTQSIYIYIYLKWGQRKRYARKESEWMGAEEMRWDEMRWWGYLIFISAVNGSFGGHVAGLEWREWASGHHCHADNVFRRFLFLILSFCPSFSIMQCISGYAPCDPSLTWKRTAACTSRKFISHQTRCVLFRTRSLWIFTIFLSEHIQFHR